MSVNREALQLHLVYKKSYFLLKKQTRTGLRGCEWSWDGVLFFQSGVLGILEAFSGGSRQKVGNSWIRKVPTCCSGWGMYLWRPSPSVKDLPPLLKTSLLCQRPSLLCLHWYHSWDKSLPIFPQHFCIVPVYTIKTKIENKTKCIKLLYLFCSLYSLSLFLLPISPPFPPPSSSPSSSPPSSSPPLLFSSPLFSSLFFSSLLFSSLLFSSPPPSLLLPSFPLPFSLLSRWLTWSRKRWLQPKANRRVVDQVSYHQCQK